MTFQELNVHMAKGSAKDVGNTSTQALGLLLACPSVSPHLAAARISLKVVLLLFGT